MMLGRTMIEVIRTFAGYPRWEGKVKSTFGIAYRCTLCGKITFLKKEIEKHDCKPKDQ